MRHAGVLPSPERRRRSRLAQIVHEEPLLKGGLVTMARTCGKKGCKCQQGEKHVSLYVAAKIGGKAKMVFVPPALERQVRAWVETYQEAAAILEQLSALQMEKLQREKAAAKAGRKGSAR